MARQLSPWLAAIPQPWRKLAQFFLVLLGVPLIAFIFGIVFSPVILLTWAVMRYGEMDHVDPASCAERYVGDGFAGNPDFYGLGIRAGTYAQWTACLMANAFLPTERRSMAGAYAAFTAALLVAVYLLVFQVECTFTAELIVVLDVLWGGSFLVLLPYFVSEPLSQQLRREANRGLALFGAAFTMFAIPVTTWFWIRLAALGEIDFVPSPMGTSFALLSHVQSSSLQTAAQFMAFICIWFVSSPFFGFISGPLSYIPKTKWIRTAVVLLSPIAVFTLLFTILFRVILFCIDSVGPVVARTIRSQARYEGWLKSKREQKELKDVILNTYLD